MHGDDKTAGDAPAQERGLGKVVMLGSGTRSNKGCEKLMYARCLHLFTVHLEASEYGFTKSNNTINC